MKSSQLRAGVNTLLLLLSAASALALVALWTITARRGNARTPGDPAGKRTLVFWIVAALVAATVGLALERGFADNTPPYDEPLIAQIGVAVFLLCTVGSVVLAALAVARFARGR